MDEALLRALRMLHQKGAWVHLGTNGKDGYPHVTPMMMGIRDEFCLFSITGQQKKRNLERDPRCCVELSRAADFFQVIMWGEMELREDAEAQALWEWLITDQFGEAGLVQRQRDLARDGTSLGIFRPTRPSRIFGMPKEA